MSAVDCVKIVDKPLKAIYGIESPSIFGSKWKSKSHSLKPFMEAMNEKTFFGLCHRVLSLEYQINSVLLDLIVKDYSNRDVKTYVEAKFPIKDLYVAKAFCRAVREEWKMLPETKNLTLSNKCVDRCPLFHVTPASGWKRFLCIYGELSSPFRDRWMTIVKN